MMTTENKIFLTQDEYETMSAKAQEKLDEFYPDLTEERRNSRFRFLMCVMAAKKVLGQPVNLDDYIPNARFQIKLNGAKIHIVSYKINDTWATYIKEHHNIRVPNFSAARQPDLVYMFVSATCDPTTYVVEGSLMHKTLMEGISLQKDYVNTYGEPNPNLPQHVEKGATIYGRTQDKSSLYVPNDFLPARGYYETIQLINKVAAFYGGKK